MGYTDDWERILNGAFGSGGRAVNFGTAGAGAKPAAPAPGTPAAPAPAAGGRTGAAADTADVSAAPAAAGRGPNAAQDAAPAGGTFDLSQLDALTAALQAQQRELNGRLQAQNAALHAGDAATQKALADSRRMLQDMEADGLLAAGTSAVPPEQRGSFVGLAEEVKKSVLGQDAFVDAFVRAMRRPFVLGTEGERARNVILVTGAEGTGRHFALAAIARQMAARGLLKSDAVAALDLSLYPNPGAEKLFLQDLYAALHAPGEILVLENYESCHAGFLKVLSDLAVRGEAPLSSRYLVKDGILVDAGTALVPGAVGSLTPCGKYLIFFSHRGRDALADRFGAAMVGAVGDVCETGAFTPESLSALAAQTLNALAQKVSARLSMTLSAGADVRDWVAAQNTKARGAAALSGACDKMFRALSEYCLGCEGPAAKAVALTIQNGAPWFSVDGAAAKPLFDLLPAEYTGAVAAVQKEMDEIVGLAPLKQYVLDLADNVRIQQRRAAAGMKTANISMHMIFTGNPGTGKTTIARIVSRYLKAIGALSGGQLVEVTRADLVGRYSGHTAPLTNSVIQSALGGVLFIDEAYSLYRGEQDSFGLEAIDTLVKGMEDHRDELVVILAGYSREMAEFLKANSGLASRFPNQVEFPDYTGEELLEITRRQAAGKGYRMAAECEAPLLAYYKVQQAVNAAKAGNGRLARNTLEKAILNQSRRLVAEPEAPLELLIRADFELGEAADAMAAADAAALAAPAQGTQAADAPAAPAAPETVPMTPAAQGTAPAQGGADTAAAADAAPGTQAADGESAPAPHKKWSWFQ